MDKNKEILDVIEDKDVNDYIKKYYKFGNIIEDMLSKLKNNGCACKCEEEDYFTTYGDNDERQDICIECGGYMEW